MRWFPEWQRERVRRAQEQELREKRQAPSKRRAFAPADGNREAKRATPGLPPSSAGPSRTAELQAELAAKCATAKLLGDAPKKEEHVPADTKAALMDKYFKE